METTLENPVIQDDADLETLRLASEKADRNEPFELPGAEQSETRTPDKTETTEQTSSPDTKPESKKDERPRDELGRFTKTETGEDIPEELRETPEAAKVEAQPAKTEQAKEDSAYIKAQKEQERQKSVLANFEREKEQHRREIEAERQRLAQERAQLQQERQQRQTQQAPQYSSQEYANFAAECKRQAKAAQDSGDYDEALKQTTLAAEATEAALKAREFEQTAEIENAAGQYESLWVQDMNERIRQEPELANRDSELAKGVMGVMQELPNFFERIPPQKLPDGRVMGGFQLAVEYYKLKKQAGLASGLEKELTKLKAENADLRQRTEIGGSGPTSPASQKKFEDMTEKEMEEHLARASAQVGMG